MIGWPLSSRTSLPALTSGSSTPSTARRLASFFKSVGRDFLSLLPCAGEPWVCFAELVNTRSARARDGDCSAHTTGVKERFKKRSRRAWVSLISSSEEPPSSAGGASGLLRAAADYVFERHNDMQRNSTINRPVLGCEH
jgi:hypothetical protein